MNRAEKVVVLLSFGWTIGQRNPRLQTDYPGVFMVVEPFEEEELPTRDGANGPWCLVGADLGALIDEAHEFLQDFVDWDSVDYKPLI